MRVRVPAALVPLLAVGLAAVLSACRPRPPELDLPALVRGHQEVVVTAGGALEPRVLGRASPVGLCLEVPPERDSSQWRARLTLDGTPLGSGSSEPSARAGRTVCFDAMLPSGLAEGSPIAEGSSLDLCGQLTDGFDGSSYRLPCRTLRWSADDRALRDLGRELSTLLAERSRRPLGAFLDDLDALGVRAKNAGLPLFAARAELVAVHFLVLEETADALGRAADRLARLPPWIDQVEVGRRGAQVAYERAELALAEGRLTAAWTALEAASRRYLRSADGERIGVGLRQADLLAQAGAPREGRDRLRAVLADCSRTTCAPGLVATARRELAWLVLLDPLATSTELDAAEADLAAGMVGLEAADEPLEYANQRLNAAYLAVRRGRDPTRPLAAARQALAGAATGEGWRRFLLGWADLVQGLAALERGDARSAVSRCAPLAAAEGELATWGASCLGEGYRLAGDRSRAARAFDQALLRHEGWGVDRLGQRLPLGPGQRADDFARAARLAVEAGKPGQAWELLARLDRLSDDEAERRKCRERAADDPELAARWRELDERSAGLLVELEALDRPSGGARRSSLEPVRRELHERLRTLWRSWPGCPQSAPAEAPGVRFRAVALPDEVLLLERADDGAVVLARRTPMARGALIDTIAGLTSALERRAMDDRTWRRTAAPLAAALLPRDGEELPELTVYALHGPLQGAPLAALPLPEGGWLADRTTVALAPAGSGHSSLGPEAAGVPLFVVDPRGDLAGASALAGTYRELFPRARLLAGEAASHAGLIEALPTASFLHIDAHGRFVSAFPELSGLELSDGPLSLIELAGLPVAGRFANLSGCQTGRWPVTADSGRYGLGGLLARLGMRWVIASRADLSDTLARDFNAVFYRAVAGGATVPVAYRQALSETARRYPASTWAALVLLRGAAAPPLPRASAGG